jgi:hypothetical protein
MSLAAVESGRQPRFRRVLVALDWGSNRAAAETVTDLAARLQAELLALFVEDIDLLRLAQHPHVNAFGLLSASGHRLAAGQLQRTLRLNLDRSRQAIADAAARRRVKYAFEVRQGRLLAEVLGAAGSDDLVIVSWAVGDGGPSWLARTTPPAAVARALAEAKVRSVLLLHPETPPGDRVLVVDDDSAAARHGLAVALQVAGDGGVIDVAMLSGRLDAAETLAAEIAQTGFDGRVRVRVLALPRVGLGDVCRIAERERMALLVVGADHALAEGEAGQRALAGIRCSVLLVR